MKKKISIAFLIAILTTMMSFYVLATETNESSNLMLISSVSPSIDYISMNEEDFIMPITNSVATDKVHVQIDGEIIEFKDAKDNIVEAKIINDRTMVPVRGIFEKFGAEVGFESGVITATTAEKEITLIINNEVAKLKDLATNEEKEIILDSVPVIVNESTLVPLSFIAESLGKTVAWDSAQRTAIIIDFEKFEKELEEKAPALKELFELEIEPVESFKTTSEITGKIIYKDLEDKKNNETVKAEGSLKVNMNKENEVEMYIDLEFAGDGTIYDSIKEAGAEELEFGIVVADNDAYMMMSNGKEEVWSNIGEVDLSQLSSIQTTDSPKSYAEFVDSIKVSLGQLNVTSYATAKQMVEVIANMYKEDNFKITGSGSKKTVKFNMDIKDFVDQLPTEILDIFKEGKMELSMVEKISNKKVESTRLTFETYFEETTTKESFEITFDIDMKFNNVNKDFDIKLPKVTVEK